MIIHPINLSRPSQAGTSSIFSILLLLAMATACAAPKPPPSPSETPTTAEPVEIRWFVLESGLLPEQIAVERDMVEAFNASHPGIQLHLEASSENELDGLLTEIAAGTAPDVVGPLNSVPFSRLYDQWLDLTPYIERAGYDLSQFDPAVLAAYHSRFGLTSLPFRMYPAAVFYQKGLFDAARLNYPPADYGQPYVWSDGTQEAWSYETLARVARRLTLDANGLDATQPGFDPGAIVQVGFVPLWQGPYEMGAFFGTASLYDAQSIVSIPDSSRAAWEWYYSGMWSPQPFIPTDELSHRPESGAWNEFDSGRAAMAITWSSLTCCLPNAGENWDLAALPSSSGAVYESLESSSFYIWKGTTHPDEAFEALTYLIGPASAKLTEAFGGMPGRVADQETYLSGLAQDFPWVSNWEVLRTGLSRTQIATLPPELPGDTAAWTRLQGFGSLMAQRPDLDLETEMNQLELDLREFLK